MHECLGLLRLVGDVRHSEGLCRVAVLCASRDAGATTCGCRAGHGGFPGPMLLLSLYAYLAALSLFSLRCMKHGCMAFPGRLFALDWNRLFSRAERGCSWWSPVVPAEGSLFGQSAWVMDRCVFVGGSSALLAAMGGVLCMRSARRGPHQAG